MQILLQGVQPFPYSAFLLCYLPLAAVVFGLLALFALTDWHARRPYLRFNPNVAAETPPEVLARRAPATGETPAGTLGGGAAANAPTTYVGSERDIIPTAPTDAPATPGQAAAELEDLGEIGPFEKGGQGGTDTLNKPARPDDSDSSRYT